MTRRIIVLVADDTQANEDLNVVLSSAVDPPWKPVPQGENVATYQQERWDQKTTDEFMLERLKRSASKVHWISSTIIPKEGKQ